jgi:spore coat polysaccharide biosynthesis protein SpsF (cytidylyltransferase family)
MESVDDILEDYATVYKINHYRGSPSAVIERMLAVADLENSDYLIRVTGDNPFTSMEYIDDQINFALEYDLDYVRLVGVPIGSTAELIKRDALVKCNQLMDPEESEYLMVYLFQPDLFRCGVIKPFKKDYSELTITVDTPEDLEKVKMIYSKLSGSILLKDILTVLKSENLTNGVNIDDNALIKMPEGKVVSYGDFKVMMNTRIDLSYKKFLYD